MRVRCRETAAAWSRQSGLPCRLCWAVLALKTSDVGDEGAAVTLWPEGLTVELAPALAMTLRRWALWDDGHIFPGRNGAQPLSRDAMHHHLPVRAAERTMCRFKHPRSESRFALKSDPLLDAAKCQGDDLGLVPPGQPVGEGLDPRDHVRAVDRDDARHAARRESPCLQ